MLRFGRIRSCSNALHAAAYLTWIIARSSGGSVPKDCSHAKARMQDNCAVAKNQSDDGVKRHRAPVMVCSDWNKLSSSLEQVVSRRDGMAEHCRHAVEEDC